MPEGSIKFSVLPAGMKSRFSHQLHEFFLKAEKNGLDSDIYVKICGNYFYTYIWLMTPFSTEKVKHSHLK